VVSTACSSSAKVFGDAARLIEAGWVDAAVVGGVTACASPPCMDSTRCSCLPKTSAVPGMPTAAACRWRRRRFALLQREVSDGQTALGGCWASARAETPTT
jgi:acetyl-CoA acetyltransferase